MQDPSVMSAALCALYELAHRDPAAYRNLIPSFTSILKQVGHTLCKRDTLCRWDTRYEVGNTLCSWDTGLCKPMIIIARSVEGIGLRTELVTTFGVVNATYSSLLHLQIDGHVAIVGVHSV